MVSSRTSKAVGFCCRIIAVPWRVWDTRQGVLFIFDTFFFVIRVTNSSTPSAYRLPFTKLKSLPPYKIKHNNAVLFKHHVYLGDSQFLLEYSASFSMPFENHNVSTNKFAVSIRVLPRLSRYLILFSSISENEDQVVFLPTIMDLSHVLFLHGFWFVIYYKCSNGSFWKNIFFGVWVCFGHNIAASHHFTLSSSRISGFIVYLCFRFLKLSKGGISYAGLFGSIICCSDFVSVKGCSSM
jgi:hypothetical protein